MSAADEIELRVLGCLYRRLAELTQKAGEIADAQTDPMRRQLRLGEYRGLVSACTVVADEFAAKICHNNPFDNPIFKGESIP